MKNTSQKIIFFGTEDFSLTTLTGLIEAGYTIAAVVTKPDSRGGRGHGVIEPAVKLEAAKHNIPIWQPEALKDIVDDIKALQPVAGVLVSFGKLIPQSIIDLFDPGIINVHPSLLPLYRGPSPIESAILNGDDKTGVTIMQLSAGMDSGPIYRVREFPLDGTETQGDLYRALSITGTDLLIEALPKILNGELKPVAQDDSLATYCGLIHKTDAAIDWNEPAEIIARKIRAYQDWPQCRTRLGAVHMIITKAHNGPSGDLRPGSIKIDNATNSLVVGTSDGCLYIESVKPIGKKEMPVQAFLDGYISRLGF